MSRINAAYEIYSNNMSLPRADLVSLFVKELGLKKSTANSYASQVKKMTAEDIKPAAISAVMAEPVNEQTDEEIWDKLEKRFKVLDKLTHAAINNICTSLIVSGPAGLGKSFTVEKALKEWNPGGEKYTILKGSVSKIGLLQTLWDYRSKDQIIVFDDCDSVFWDDVSVSLLKAACDSTEERYISYKQANGVLDSDSAGMIDPTFKFEGTIIFISNTDFDAHIARGTKLAPHLQAMVSRSHYIDLEMKTRRDYFIRIKQVVDQGMLKNLNLTAKQQKDVMQFIEDNLSSLREVSLRIAIKVAQLIQNDPKDWKDTAMVTCVKNR